MKRRKNDFKDPTPENTPYEGNLAYGRCFGNDPGRGDYPAYRDKNGVPANKAIITLPLVRKKDEVFWERVQRPKSQYYDNTQLRKEFLNKLEKALVKNTLKYNLTLVTIGDYKSKVV